MQSFWKADDLQPPTFKIPKFSVMPLEFMCKRREVNLLRKYNFFHEMSLSPLTVMVYLRNLQALLTGRWDFGSPPKIIQWIIMPIRLWKLVGCNYITTKSLPYHMSLRFWNYIFSWSKARGSVLFNRLLNTSSNSWRSLSALHTTKPVSDSWHNKNRDVGNRNGIQVKILHKYR